MISRNLLANICVELTKRYKSLVFWKHLERGLDGYGDIDTFSAHNQMDRISLDFINLIFMSHPNSRAAVTCSHLSYAKLNFIILDSYYPQLLEFDVGSMVKRFGIPWLDAQTAVDFSEINAEGIRVLQPGALSVALLVLYGLSFCGSNKLRDYDHKSILHGIRNDNLIAQKFCKNVFPKKISGAILIFLEKLKSIDWSNVDSRRVFSEFFKMSLMDSLKGNNKHLLVAIKDKCRSLCVPRRTIIFKERVAAYANWQDFIKVSSENNHKILFAPQVNL